MTGFTIKMIAIVAMLIDHVAMTLVTNHDLYLVMRAIGRIAFPIFAFLLVEGYCHTSNVNKYLRRLVIFALISEIPFDLAFFHTFWYPEHQNVFITLALGLLMLDAMRRAQDKYGEMSQSANRIMWLAFIVAALTAQLTKCDYQSAGILMILFFYKWRGRKWLLLLNLVIVNLILFTPGIQAFGIAAIFFIWAYNGEKGKSMKYFFYAFYPVHLTILYLIQCYR